MLAYFDCFSGISGDMTLGALIDLGVPAEWLQKKLTELPLEGVDLEVQKVHRNGIAANRVEVVCREDTVERSHADIVELLMKAPLSDSARASSLGIFNRLAEAEAGIHGCDVAEVHFHEVGATDAIADIVGAVLGLEYLDVTRVVGSRLSLGTGFVNCRHGRIPVPAPATLALLREVPVVGTNIEAELVTPTGAAIITGMAREFGPQPAMQVHRCGYGAGRRELDPGPNLLRIVLGSGKAEETGLPDGMERDSVWILETAIDDMSAELVGFCVERLFEEGALDVALIPIYMKKNRPATMVQVICREDRKEALLTRLLTDTTTTGVRHYQTHRRVLAREEKLVTTSFGKIAVKQIRLPGGRVRLAPEYDVCRKIALEKKLPLREIYDKLIREIGGA